MSGALRGSCRLAPLAGFAAVVALIGCGNPEDRYKPAAETAREHLEVALSTWQSGAPLATITSTDPPIDVFEARWRSGRKLEHYEILQEIEGEPHTTFAVKLKLADAKEEEETRYLVMGIDPILVFRSEDYGNAQGM